MPEKTEENLEFLRRIEIRTMRKDIAWLQAGGKEKEREMLEKLKMEEGRRQKLMEEKIRKEGEEKTIEEIKRRAEEEKIKIEIERIKAEEEEIKRTETERIKAEEEEKRKIEEEKKRIEEAQKRTETERIKAEEEEKRKIEEEKKRIEEELRKGVIEAAPEKPKISLEEEKIKIAEEFQKIAGEKKPFELKRDEFLKKLRPIESAIAVILKKEQLIEGELIKIEERERSAESEREKRETEKKRWETEEKRRQTEKERWPWMEEKRKIERKIQGLDLEFQEILKKEGELRERQKEIFAKEERIKLEKEKNNLERELERIEENKRELAAKREELYKNLVEIKDNLKVVLEKERKVEEDKRLIEEEEELTFKDEERQRMEKERWEIEEKRKKIEKERWGLEEEKNRMEAQIKKLEMNYQGALEKTDEINKRLREIDLELKPEREKKIPVEIKKVSKEELKKPEEIEVLEKERKIEVEEKPLGEKEKIEEAQKKIEEAKRRIEALKREEERKKLAEELEKREIKPTEKPIIEMPFKKPTVEEIKEPVVEIQKNGRDWEKLEKEWKKLEKEREKSFGVIEEKEERKGEEKPPLSQAPVQIVRPLPKKPSFKERIGIRIVILLLLLLIFAGLGAFWYWFFNIRKPKIPPPPPPPVAVECKVDTDCPDGKVCQAGSCVVPPPVTEIPPSLFSVDDTLILSVSSPEELRILLLQEIQTSLNNIDQFKRVVIKDVSKNKVLGLRDFFEALLIRAPEELYQKLGNDFTLFIYSQSEGNRIGFVTEIKNSAGLTDLLISRETTMENDFQTFFELVGKQAASIVPYFRNASNVRGYTGPNFRYQSIAREDLGICYLIAGNYFVFTSSWKSMEKTITKLALSGKPLEITSELKLGNSGNEVELLQTWLKQEPVVYPEGRVTGYFGELTQAAVIRFQEKYAAEILAPQGFIKGTGIIDLYTRIKLNEIYGKSGIIPPVPEITTDLRYGDHGNEVKLLQAWLAKDQKIYPEGKISGWFGYATQRAIIRFQEKYASEILTPQGLSRGTGIVDVLTRKKLNELYGNK